ncbi:MAG TPA: peptide ABC transporter substrate-binding protein [Stellaceae bacterium]|nr:peptide ABC transporter substrate-binding protein [Stellaceae bacterium]
MTEYELRALIGAVRAGWLSRRGFVRRMAALGLSAPFVNMMLAHEGVAAEPAPFAYKPTKAGGGGTLKLLWWEGPTLLNPHFAVGTKDQDGSRIFYEPLAGWDAEGNLVPVLAAELPDAKKGTVSSDGTTVTWKLKQGVRWHDGQPFTADDCVFNWQYASDPATAATTIGDYKDLKVTKVDDHTIKVIFPKPTPFWASAFVGVRGMVIPKHLFEKYKGGTSRDAPGNLAPVGTGPYMFVDFKPGDLVRGKRNPNYHMPNRPYFDMVEMKGGGEAVSAARAVLQTGEYDFAWNLQVEDEILKRLEQGGRGHIEITPTGNIEHIELNATDPWTTVDGERSSIKTKHPFFSDPAVRQALNLLVDRLSVQKYIYGRTGVATANFINNPKRFRSSDTHYEFNIQKATALLDKAGWKPGSDGIREKNGVKLKVVFQTSVNAPRQKNQEIIKEACQKAGIGMDLKAVLASVFFSSDIGNPDTYAKFYSDMQMFTTTMTQPDPGLFMRQFLSTEVAQKANKWQGRNITRWRNPAYDALFHASESELDPVKRAALFIKMNDLVVDNVVVIPEIYRPTVSGIANGLNAPVSGWDSDLWALQDWYRTNV